jgi:hypothetical protein
LSILRDEIGEDAKRHLLDAVVDMMEDRYPESNKSLFVFVSDQEGDIGLEDELRPGADEVMLHDE